MEMAFTKIAVQNNQASADLSFRPKTGAPTGATMQVSYNLEKQDGAWKIIKKSAPGGMIEHPNPNVNPHGQPAAGSFTETCQTLLLRNHFTPRYHSKGHAGLEGRRKTWK